MKGVGKGSKREEKRLKKEVENTQEAIRAGHLPCRLLSPMDDAQDLSVWRVILHGPPNSPYAGGNFRVQLNIGPDYPYEPPKVSFDTMVYHCNISVEGRVCVSTLGDEWSPALTIRTVLLSIFSLLTDPNPYEPLNREAARVFIRDPLEYQLLARECVQRHSAEELIPATPQQAQLVLTLFSKSLGSTFFISGVNAGGNMAAVVELQGSATVFDVHDAFCRSLKRDFWTVTLILPGPEGFTLREAMENIKSIGAMSERRDGVSFDEILLRNQSDEAFVGQPYDYILSRSVQQWDSLWEELQVARDAYTIKDLFAEQPTADAATADAQQAAQAVQAAHLAHPARVVEQDHATQAGESDHASGPAGPAGLTSDASVSDTYEDASQGTAHEGSSAPDFQTGMHLRMITRSTIKVFLESFAGTDTPAE